MQVRDSREDCRRSRLRRVRLNTYEILASYITYLIVLVCLRVSCHVSAFLGCCRKTRKTGNPPRRPASPRSTEWIKLEAVIGYHDPNTLPLPYTDLCSDHSPGSRLGLAINTSPSTTLSSRRPSKNDGQHSPSRSTSFP